MLIPEQVPTVRKMWCSAWSHGRIWSCVWEGEGWERMGERNDFPTAK